MNRFYFAESVSRLAHSQHCFDSAVLSDDIVIKGFLHNWLTTFKSYEVCSRTMELYYSSERLHIVPALGNIPLKDLTPMRVQTFLYQLQAEKQLSTRSISQIRGTLIQMYDHAIDMQLVENNPARNSKLPKRPRKAGDGDELVSIHMLYRKCFPA